MLVQETRSRGVARAAVRGAVAGLVVRLALWGAIFAGLAIAAVVAFVAFVVFIQSLPPEALP